MVCFGWHALTGLVCFGLVGVFCLVCDFVKIKNACPVLHKKIAPCNGQTNTQDKKTQTQTGMPPKTHHTPL